MTERMNSFLYGRRSPQSAVTPSRPEKRPNLDPTKQSDAIKSSAKSIGFSYLHLSREVVT